MAGKRSKKLKRNVAKKKPKIVVETRQQVLSTDTLSDIFDASKRIDLDNWNVVSRQYIQAISRAKSLRTVNKVTLTYDETKEVYKTSFFFENPNGSKDTFELWRCSGDPADPRAFLFKTLRFCFVDGPIIIGKSINIDREFMKCIKNIKDDFLIKDSLLLTLGSYYSEYETSTTQECLDALCSFPSLRALNESTYGFAFPWDLPVDNGFLKMLASHGIFEVGAVEGPPWRVDNGIRGDNTTEDEIIDYCFGDYDDSGKGRLLHIKNPQLSPKFVTKLVEACRASKSNHKLQLNIATGRIKKIDQEDFVPNGEELSGPRGMRWQLRIDDLNLCIAYWPSGQRLTRYLSYGLIDCERY